MDGIIGMIKMVLGDTPPPGWVFCDGSILQVAEHPELAVMLGNRYGGDGTETFGLPQFPAPPAGNYVVCVAEPANREGTFKGLISQITLYVGQDLPEGWIYCDGRVLAADKYPVLAQVMGSNYGGDGKTTVGIPSMQAAPGIEYIMCVEGVDPRGDQASGDGDDDDDY